MARHTPDDEHGKYLSILEAIVKQAPGLGQNITLQGDPLGDGLFWFRDEPSEAASSTTTTTTTTTTTANSTANAVAREIYAKARMATEAEAVLA